MLLHQGLFVRFCFVGFFVLFLFLFPLQNRGETQGLVFVGQALSQTPALARVMGVMLCERQF